MEGRVMRQANHSASPSLRTQQPPAELAPEIRAVEQTRRKQAAPERGKTLQEMLAPKAPLANGKLLGIGVSTHPRLLGL